MASGRRGARVERLVPTGFIGDLTDSTNHARLIDARGARAARWGPGSGWQSLGVCESGPGSELWDGCTVTGVAILHLPKCVGRTLTTEEEPGLGRWVASLPCGATDT
jgi:hypothetical protein